MIKNTYNTLIANTLTEVLAKVSWQENKVKGIWIRKKEIIPSLFYSDIVIYIENKKKKLTKYLLKFRKVIG